MPMTGGNGKVLPKVADGRRSTNASVPTRPMKGPAGPRKRGGSIAKVYMKS